MKKSGIGGRVASHAIALLIGALLAFGTLKVMSSQAETLSLAPSKSSPENSVEDTNVTAQNTGSARFSTNFVASAIAKTGPAVVRIDTERTVIRRVDPFFDDPFFRQFFGDRFGQQQQQPRERQVRGQGSGFITDKSGIILTNAHVVSGADRVIVTLRDGREFEGTVKGTDEVTDLAVVQIDPQGSDLPIAPLGNSSQVQVGDWAIAVGNPVGLNNTVTLGIISTLERSSAQVGIPDKRVEFLQTDAAINPGNSGGPLLDQNGEVIGINTAIRADATGIGFAIPIDKAKELKDILAAGREVPHPYVGVQMITLTPEIAQQNNNDPNSPLIIPEVDGVLVIRVLPNTPAQRAGIRRGDVIVDVDGTAINSANQLQTVVENSGLNQSLKFKIIRGDQQLQLDVQTAQLASDS
ncbi:trypsin-like serine protease with C-terminal PDZ domain [Xenococcus sp. PCC 7305]|uniref:HhoA/HhoB/HtrA family serine endopeptidase n=1 Tax=Xenococcus sp. PCC 7305 TaxID=102125 RepID=UPI0002ACFED4|nr:HhoA/HhoB/HtrA family serine endopeptidase [Xenococcus sp. PCC 7305]ELS04704.1 trypsin-like serine protease with C-terminal PDZ domain [Xenococcus sp. PCC 7305]